MEDNRNLNAMATLGDIADVVGPMSGAIATLGKRVSELNRMLDRFALHEAKIAQLSESQLKFAGPWRDGRECMPGELLSFQGGLWHCNERTMDRPATSKAFTLCVKRGRGE